MLKVSNLDLFYGDAQALDKVSIEVAEGEVVAIVGANGAGKSSLIRTLFGMHQPARGDIVFEGRNITGEASHRICNIGIGQVAEGRQIFPTMTVSENLEMGAVVPRARSGRSGGDGACSYTVSPPAGTPQATRWHAIRWRATNAGDSPLSDGATAPHHAG